MPALTPVGQAAGSTWQENLSSTLQQVRRKRTNQKSVRGSANPAITGRHLDTKY
jgi:hypothetical protein